MARIIFSQTYNKNLERIENHIFETTDSIEFVSEFLDEHDNVLRFIEQNPMTAATHPTTGDQSWIFGDGRYRIFFKVVIAATEVTIYLIHIIDNKELNEDIYPGNRISSYSEE